MTSSLFSNTSSRTGPRIGISTIWYQEMTGVNGLEVIGAGFSKTGTKTMHHVYKILGYGINDSHENVFL